MFHLLGRLQSVRVDFGDEVGFRHSVVVLADRVNVHQAVICHLNTLEVREKPAKQKTIIYIYSL